MPQGGSTFRGQSDRFGLCGGGIDVLDSLFNLDLIGRALPMLLAGLANTLLLAAAAALIGAPLGFAAGLARAYGGPLLRGLAGGWIDLLRALPTLVLLLVIFYALPHAGLPLSGLAAAIIGLSLAFSALTAEALRRGIAAVPRGQVLAADALGVARGATLRQIVLPQALRAAAPAHAANGVSIARDTALASVIAVPELLARAGDPQALAREPAPLLAAALLYLAVLLPALWLVRRLEAQA